MSVDSPKIASATWPSTRPVELQKIGSSSRTRRSSRRSGRASRRACCSTVRRHQQTLLARLVAGGRRAVLLDLGLGLRRDVRRRRRLARARPVRAASRTRPASSSWTRSTPSAVTRCRPRRWPRRARADAQPAARRDGQRDDEGQHHSHRRHQPAGHPRPGAARGRFDRQIVVDRPDRKEPHENPPRGAHPRRSRSPRRSSWTRS